MNTSRQTTVQMYAKSAINSLFSSARFSHLSSEKINDKFLEIKKDLPKGTPRHIRAFLDGMRDVHSEYLMRECLEFCYMVTGTTRSQKGRVLVFHNDIVSTVRKSPRYYEAFQIQPSELQKISVSSGFYYIDTKDPYFVTNV